MIFCNIFSHTSLVVGGKMLCVALGWKEQPGIFIGNLQADFGVAICLIMRIRDYPCVKFGSLVKLENFTRLLKRYL